MWPASSSASRIAPMRPSIMSEGATKSQPASACASDILTSASTVGVVDHVAAVVDQAVLAMRGERIERDIGDHAQLGKLRLQRAHGALRQAIGIPCLARVFATWPRPASPETARAPECRRRMRLLGQRAAVRRSTSRSTPGIDGTGRAAVALVHEHRQDQVARGQQGSRASAGARSVAAHAAGTDKRMGHCGTPRDVRHNNPSARYRQNPQVRVIRRWPVSQRRTPAARKPAFFRNRRRSAMMLDGHFHQLGVDFALNLRH